MKHRSPAAGSPGSSVVGTAVVDVTVVVLDVGLVPSVLVEVEVDVVTDVVDVLVVVLVELVVTEPAAQRRQVRAAKRRPAALSGMPLQSVRAPNASRWIRFSGTCLPNRSRQSSTQPRITVQRPGLVGWQRLEFTMHSAKAESSSASRSAARRPR